MPLLQTTHQIQSAGTRILIVERHSLGITLPTLVQVLPRYRSGQHHQQQLQPLLTIATPCVPSKARTSACVWYAYNSPLDGQLSSASTTMHTCLLRATARPLAQVKAAGCPSQGYLSMATYPVLCPSRGRLCKAGSAFRLVATSSTYHHLDNDVHLAAEKTTMVATAGDDDSSKG